MAEYWVSQSKFHCDFCKCWIADNKPSRDFHERGKRHQDNVKKKIEEVRKSSVAKAQKEEEMNDYLREMNENAMKALKKDLMTNPSLASQYGIKLKPKEPEELPEYGPAPRPEPSASDKDDSDNNSEDSPNTEDSEATPSATVTSTVGTWHMAASEQGYPYYWNDITSEVSWVPPPAYLAQQAGQGASHETPQEQPRTSSSEPTMKKKKKKRSKELEETVANTSDTEKQISNEPEVPVVKKPKTDEPEPVIVADIPLPCDIPLPPPPGIEDEAQSDEIPAKEEEEESKESDEETKKSKPRHPKSNIAYGTWEQIEEQSKMEDIDLGLPQVKEEQVVTIPVAEPKFKFREKTVSSLGSGPVFFKKPKKKMTAAQFLKKREDS